MKARSTSILFLTVSLLLGAERLPAQTLDLSPVPETLPAETRDDLVRQRAELQARWDAFLTDKAAFVSAFAGTLAGTPKAAQAEARKAELQSVCDAIVDDADRFNEQVSKSAQALVQSDGKVDPRNMVMKSDYDDALQFRDRLKKRQALLEGELAKLHHWEGDLRKESGEFERLREAAQIDCLHDILLKIPAGSCFNGLVNQGLLAEEEAKVLKNGYDALKLLVDVQQASSAKNDSEQIEKVLDARKELRALLMDEAVKKLTPEARTWLNAMEGVFDATASGLASESGRQRPYEAIGKGLVSVGTAVFPPAALVTVADTLLEKSLTQHVVAEPLASLNEALSSNFNARRYLETQLEFANYNLRAVEETISKYEAVHPSGQ